jgi:hypothetical protein
MIGKPLSADVVVTAISCIAEDAMPKCDVCGNDYDKAFQVIQAGRTMTFDSFECAIHAMAPTCARCGCKIVGHGLEAGGAMYCCAHCAGPGSGLKDRT